MDDKESISEVFSRIDSYLYKYNDKAKDLYQGTKGVDDKEHFGVMAQELQENPVTSATVQTDENGYLEVDTAQLVMTLTAVVSDLAKRVNDLENVVKNSLNNGELENGN